MLAFYDMGHNYWLKARKLGEMKSFITPNYSQSVDELLSFQVEARY